MLSAFVAKGVELAVVALPLKAPEKVGHVNTLVDGL